MRNPLLVALILTVGCTDREAVAPIVGSPSFTLLQEITVSKVTSPAVVDFPGPPWSGQWRAFNDAGQLTGSWLEGCCSYHPFIWQDGLVTEVGFLAQGSFAYSVGLNGLGHVIGYGGDGRGQVHAFLWKEGLMQDLGALPGGNFSVPKQVNELGQVVGFSSTRITDHAFLWQNGAMIDLGTLVPGGGSTAEGVNNLGEVVGLANVGSSGEYHAVLYRTGVVTDLGLLPGVSHGYSWASSINDRGDIMGMSTKADSRWHAVIWRDEVIVDLGDLGGGWSFPLDLNEIGEVVGWSTTPEGDSHAFLWDGTELRDLGTLGGRWSMANGINDLSQVVGESETAAGATHGFLWENGSMNDLGTLPGERSSKALAINNRAQIVGIGDLGSLVWTVAVRSATPREEIEILRENVSALVVSARLTVGQGAALIARLEAAALQLDNGHQTAAIRLFEAFTNQVEAFVRAGILQSDEGRVLVDAAENAIAQLAT